MDKNTKHTLNSGNKMPILGLGTWQLTNDTADVVAYALEKGYELIDTSSDYGTQPGVGKGIKKSGKNREDIFIVTKVEETDDAYERTKSNLKELNVDYVDLMLIHRPPAHGAGEELWKGLIRARNEGLVKDIGVSNYSIEQIEKLIGDSKVVPAVNQIEWSPFGHSMKMLNYCKEKGIIIQAYSPLSRQERLDDDRIKTIADKHKVSPAQVMIRWNLQLGTCPLPKANKLEHIQNNINVFGFELDEQDMNTLSELNEHYSALGNLPYVDEQQKASA